MLCAVRKVSTQPGVKPHEPVGFCEARYGMNVTSPEFRKRDPGSGQPSRSVATVKEPTGPPPARPPEAKKSSDGKGYVVRKEPIGPPPARPSEARKRSDGNRNPKSRKEPTGPPPARPSEARKRSDGKSSAIRSQRSSSSSSSSEKGVSRKDKRTPPPKNARQATVSKE